MRAEAEAAAEREAEARRMKKDMQGEVEEAHEIIGDLDSALKAFTGALGLEVQFIIKNTQCICVCLYVCVWFKKSMRAYV